MSIERLALSCVRLTKMPMSHTTKLIGTRIVEFTGSRVSTFNVHNERGHCCHPVFKSCDPGIVSIYILGEALFQNNLVTELLRECVPELLTVGTRTSMRSDTGTVSSSRVPRVMNEKEIILSWRFIWDLSWTGSALRYDLVWKLEGLDGGQEGGCELIVLRGRDETNRRIKSKPRW